MDQATKTEFLYVKYLYMCAEKGETPMGFKRFRKLLRA